MSKKKKNQKDENNYNNDNDDQEYYDRHPLQIPEGCRACGGPYPDCRSSCSMFDD